MLEFLGYVILNFYNEMQQTSVSVFTETHLNDICTLSVEEKWIYGRD